MIDSEKTELNQPDAFSRQISAQVIRKLKARRHAADSVWFGLGMTGLIGWSVSAPTLLGTALGMWLDSHYPGIHSWTLALLVVGLAVGCLNAWHWVDMEQKAMLNDEDETSE